MNYNTSFDTFSSNSNTKTDTPTYSSRNLASSSSSSTTTTNNNNVIMQ